MRTVGHLGTKVTSVLAELDQDGNARKEFPIEVALRVMTPLACLELYEQWHLRRNAIRDNLGLAEIPLPAGLDAAKEALAKGLLELVERQVVAMRNGEAEPPVALDFQRAALAAAARKGEG